MEASNCGCTIFIQIQLKAEVNNPISKFFSTKRTKREELNLEVENSCAESFETFKTDPSKSMKKELNTEGNTPILSFTEGDQGSKSTIIHSQDSTAKCQMKWDNGEFQADSEPITDETIKLCSTPARKKRNLKSASDKQPTLFSYYGKN
jgi:hypothetical protein